MEGEAVGDAAAAAVVTPLAALVAGGRQEGDIDLRIDVLWLGLWQSFQISEVRPEV